MRIWLVLVYPVLFGLMFIAPYAIADLLDFLADKLKEK